MLMFIAEHVPMILSGDKTETRRLWNRARAKVGSLHKCYSGGLPISKCVRCSGSGRGAIRLQMPVSYDYAPCPACHGTGRLQPFATVRVRDVRPQRLGWVSQREAEAEGYTSVDAFLAAFERINHRRLLTLYDDSFAGLRNQAELDLCATEVFVVKFKLSEPQP